MMFYTYVLQSQGDEWFYVGFTKDLKLRFEEHCKGRVESTRERRPLKLIYYEACLRQDDATKREKYLKTYHGKMFIRNRLKSYLTGWIRRRWGENSVCSEFLTRLTSEYWKVIQRIQGCPANCKSCQNFIPWMMRKCRFIKKATQSRYIKS